MAATEPGREFSFPRSRQHNTARNRISRSIAGRATADGGLILTVSQNDGSCLAAYREQLAG
jgi:hypothetical protein